MGGKSQAASIVTIVGANNSVQYYFSYCEAGFLTRTLGDVIITVAREGTMELMEGIPL